MKVLICSDLHTNFHRDFGKNLISGLSDADVAVVAGDISSGSFAIQTAIEAMCNKYEHVVYVVGNHEYYDSNFKKMDDQIRVLAESNTGLHWLDNSKVNINGITFIGGTLWFKNDPAIPFLRGFLNDFRLIKEFEPEVYERFNNTVEYLTNNIREGDVVVTHHMPSYQCISPRFVGNKVSCFFATDLEELIINTKPSIWIHGHTHDCQKCIIGNTTVIGNPFGYPGENYMFDDNLVLNL